MLSFRTLTLLISTSALLQTASATTPADSALLQTASAATPADEKVAEKHALDVHPCADFDVAEPHDKTYDPKTIKCPFLKWTFGRARVKKVHVRNFNWQDPEQWLKILNPPTGAAADGGPILSRGEILTCTQKRLKFHGLSPKWLASVIAVAKGQGNCTRVADGGDADGCTLDLMNLFKAKAVPEILTFAQAVLRIEPSSPYYLDASKVNVDFHHNHMYGTFLTALTPREDYTLQDLINLKVAIAHSKGERAIGFFSELETENIFLRCGGTKEQHTVKKECILDFFAADSFERRPEFTPDAVVVPGPLDRAARNIPTPSPRVDGSGRQHLPTSEASLSEGAHVWPEGSNLEEAAPAVVEEDSATTGSEQQLLASPVASSIGGTSIGGLPGCMRTNPACGEAYRAGLELLDLNAVLPAGLLSLDPALLDMRKITAETSVKVSVDGGKEVVKTGTEEIMQLVSTCPAMLKMKLVSKGVVYSQLRHCFAQLSEEEVEELFESMERVRA